MAESPVEKAIRLTRGDVVVLIDTWLNGPSYLVTFLRYKGDDRAVVKYVGTKETFEMTVLVTDLREMKRKD